MRKKETYQKYKDLHDEEFYKNLDYTNLKHCSSCKNELPLSNFSKHSREITGFSYICKKCNLKLTKNRGINLVYFKSKAEKRGLEFDLEQKDLFLPVYCPILNIKLEYNQRKKASMMTSPSLDRIDNSKGYVKGNVIVISTLANAMKNKANFEQLRLFAKNIIKLIDYYEMQGALGDITDIFPDIKERSLDL
jgi:hypothetical protein